MPACFGWWHGSVLSFTTPVCLSRKLNWRRGPKVPPYSPTPGGIPQSMELSIQDNFTAGLDGINETQEALVKVTHRLT